MNLNGKPLDDMSITEVRALVSTLEARNEELITQVGDDLAEAGEFGTAQLALENIGWRPLAGYCDDGNTFTLDSLHRISELCRAVATVNPLVERGLKVRTGYIWGSGVSVVPEEFIQGPGRPRTVNTDPSLPEGLTDVLTGTLAQMEIEMSASCDGNLFFLVDKRNKTVQRVPFEEISGGVSQRGNKEKLLYIRRTWNDWDLEYATDRNIDTHPFTDPDPLRGRNRSWVGPNAEDVRRSAEEPQYSLKSVWYPTFTITAANRRQMGTMIQRNRIWNEPTDHNLVMVHIPFNRMTGWRWGVPDVLPAVWWTKAYKEYLENCAVLTKAYARFAWKVTNEKSRGVRRTAAQLAQAPRTDPSTGQPLAVGASAVLGAGQDLAAVGNSRAVDFDAGRPLAAMVAAALDVPLPALTADPSIGNRTSSEALDTSTVLVMQARQRTMNEAYLRIFEMLGLKVRLRWPEISEEPVHRRLQAIDMAARMGVVTAEETRAMVLDAWHDKWDDFPAKPPTPEQLPLILQPNTIAMATGGTPSGQPGQDGTDDSGGGASDASVTGDSGPGLTNPLKSGSRLGGRPSSTGLPPAPRQPDPISKGDTEPADD
jgi:hypothetical protein